MSKEYDQASAPRPRPVPKLEHRLQAHHGVGDASCVSVEALMEEDLLDDLGREHPGGKDSQLARLEVAGVRLATGLLSSDLCQGNPCPSLRARR